MHFLLISIDLCFQGRIFDAAKLKQKYELYENSIHLFCNELFKKLLFRVRNVLFAKYVEYER